MTKIEDKLKRQGGRIAKIDRGFPSSKRCACYGAIKKELELSARDWPCVACGKIRYGNASQNLRTEAIVEGIVILQAAGLSVAAHGGCIRPARIAQAAVNQLGSLGRQAYDQSPNFALFRLVACRLMLKY